MWFTKEISLDDFYSLYNQHANHWPHN
jgi:hypothetical protein